MGCGGADRPEFSMAPGEPKPEQEIWGWTTVVTKRARKRALVTADHYQKYDRSHRAELDGGVTVVFYDSAGADRISTLTARAAEIDEKTRDMLAAGDVVLLSEDSTRLEADTLNWHHDSEKVTGDGKVVIRRPDGLETGVGFEASSDLKRWTLRQVTTRLGRRDSLPP